MLPLRTNRRTRPSLRVELLEERRVPTTFADSRFIESQVVSGLTTPTSMAVAPDGRIFVTEKAGAVRVIENGVLLPTPFLTVATDPQVEKGLLGITFDPNFEQNGFVYIYYTVPEATLFNRVSRFTANGNTAVANSELVLMNLDPILGAGAHNGGALHFGPDGKLYIATGDALVQSNSQSLTTRHGKILRINPDGSIPADNPTVFDGVVGQTTGVNRAIWAIGLRNPFTFAIQPGTGMIFINDVGQISFEEINLGGAGANYGWPQSEGPNPANLPGVTYPVYAYPHGSVSMREPRAIAGGAFYNPDSASFPSEYINDYFFADVVASEMYLRDDITGQVTTFATDLTGVAPLDIDLLPDGSLLYLSLAGAIYRIQFAPNSPPVVTIPPQSQIVPVNEDTTFSVTVAGVGPFTYQWFLGDDPIDGATQASYTVTSPQLGQSGSEYAVEITNVNGTTRSHVATLTVVDKQRPTANITLPTPDALFRGGETITFAGTAFEDGGNPLPASAYTWRVEYITGAAAPRPFVQPVSGIVTGTFTTAQQTPYTLTDVAYRITLTVTDPIGLTQTVSRDILPVVGTFTLTSNIAGVTLSLDGQPILAGTSVAGVVGVQRSIGAPPQVVIDGKVYRFAGWSDGGAQVHNIFTPDGNTVFVARYRLADQIAVAASGSPVVVVYDGPTGEELTRFFAYNPAFTGEVRVAVGDVDGDGIPDIITAAGPGGGPHVQVFSGATGELIRSFFAYNPAFVGGVYVAAADVNGDGFADIITGLGPGGGPHVQVFSGRTGETLMSFFAYNPLFSGGVNVAVGDVDGDGRIDIITAAGPGGGPHVQVFSGLTGESILSFFAFDPLFSGGVNVAAGDFTGDGLADIAVAVAFGGGPHVKVFRGTDLAEIASFFAYSPIFLGGVRLGVADANGDGMANVLTGPGPGGGADVRAFRVPGDEIVRGLFAFDPAFLGGVYVGGG